MDRFKMNFNQTQPIPFQQPTEEPSKPKVIFNGRSGNAGLKAPMIERVHKVRPGCSACGKKVA